MSGPVKEMLAFPGKPGAQVIEARVCESSIESVVVYQDRAEVKRQLPVRLCAGENEVIVYDLADCVDKNSIRVEGKGDAVITDVIYSSKTTSEQEETTTGSKEEFQKLKDEIAETEREFEQLKVRKEVLEEEKTLLNRFADHISNIHTVKGDDNSLSQLVDQQNISIVMEFFEKVESKMADLDSRLYSLRQQSKTLSVKLGVLRNNADKINPETKSFTSETIRTLHVGLEAASEGEAILFVSYVVTNASWSSSYDVRVFTKENKMKVQYYGLIKQKTGEDWENAKISLSTAQPSVGGSAPSLPTRLIRFKRPKPRWANYQAMSMSMGGPPPPSAPPPPGGIGLSKESYSSGSEDEYEDEWIEDQAFMNAIPTISKGLAKHQKGRRQRSISPLDVDVAEVTAGLFNTTYAIPRVTTIPADNTEHKVTIALIDLSPEFTYTSVPRLSPYSFLQAKAKNSSHYTILKGPANIFLDNNFIAKSELSDVSPNEEFTTSLGADQSIRITCMPIATVHNTRTGMLGGSKTNYVTYTHSFVVKNTRSDSVKIKVSEQVPLSTDDRIKVTVTNPELKKVGVVCPLPFGRAVLTDSNNVDWHAEVGAGKELDLKLVYTVEHPAQDGVEGLLK